MHCIEQCKKNIPQCRNATNSLGIFFALHNISLNQKIQREAGKISVHKTENRFIP